MKVIKNIVFVIVITAALLAASYFGYKFYKKIKTPAYNIINAIPNNSAFIVKFKSLEDIREYTLLSDDTISQLILNDSLISLGLTEFDSLIHNFKSNHDFYSVIKSKPLYFSLHMTGLNEFGGLFVIKPNKTANKEQLLEILNNDYQISNREIEGVTIYEVKKNKEIHSFVWSNGLLAYTKNSKLIDKYVYSILNYNEDARPLIKKMIKAEGKDTYANIYIDYNFLYRFISKYANKSYTNVIKELKKFSSKAVLDLNINDDFILLNGYSNSSDSFNTFLSSLKNVEAGSIDFDAVMPQDIAYFIAFGANDINKYLSKLEIASWNIRKKEELQKVKDLIDDDLDSYFNEWIDKEIVSLTLQTDYKNIKENSFALIKSIDSKEAKQKLDDLTLLVNKKKNIDSDTIFYRNYEIKQINIPYLLSSLYGDFFENIPNTYYTLVNNYVLFANSPSAIQKYLNAIMVENTLNKQKSFIDFKNSLSSESHLLIYANLKKSSLLYPNFLSNEYANSNLRSFIKTNLQGVGLQFLSTKSGSYTSVVLQQSTKSDESEPISWQTALDADAVWGPYSIINHYSGKREVLIVDKNNILYRINASGKIEWKIPIPSKPISSLYLIDYYDNGKYQYLFNTKNSIYLYDLNGNTVEDYPVSLDEKAGSGLLLLKYPGTEKYRILIPDNKKRLLSYTKEGIKTEGWQNPKMEYDIKTPAQYFRLGNKDIIVVSDTMGNVIYANRKGENRIETKLAFTNNYKTKFYKNGDKLLTSDIAGRIVEVDFNGNVEKTLVGDFSLHHSYYFEDFNNDRIKEHIFIDKNKLQIFGADNNLIMEKQFDFKLSSKIEFVNSLQNDSIFMILQNLENKELVFIGKSHQIKMNKTYKSDFNFITSNATKQKKLRLITVNGRVISNYIFDNN